MNPEFYKLPNKKYSFEITITSEGKQLYQVRVQAEVLPNVVDRELQTIRQNSIIETLEETLALLKKSGDFNDLTT